MGESLTTPRYGPTIRLVYSGAGEARYALCGGRGIEQVPEYLAPALLVSFLYADAFVGKQSQFRYRDWALDSGAFSVRYSGATVDLEEYIDLCLQLMERDPTLVDIFSLDVIGDWRGTMRNTERMWARGVPAIPTYRAGEPEDWLMGIAKDYPKIALGRGQIRVESEKEQFARQVFARVWPCKIHGFAFAGESLLMELPWHSVDANSWMSGPMYGNWKSMPGAVSRSKDVRGELGYWIALEKRVRARWRKTWEELDGA